MNTAAKRMTFTGVSLFVVLLGTTASAQNSAPDTCVSGFVWREAFPGDHVCVDPAVRRQAASDNQSAVLRRAGGGPYGPDTCRQGFVWREARPSDHVCVIPQTRTQTASDNQAASSRVARSPSLAQIARPNTVVRPDIVARPDAVVRPDVRIDRGAAVIVGTNRPPAVLQPPPPRPAPGAAAKRGFDENGQPYIEETLSDGSIRRQHAQGVTVIKPDGTSQYYPASVIRSEVQPLTPPALPTDPALGLDWVSFHNQRLLDLIGLLVRNDQTELQRFNAAESTAVGSDLFRQVEYRTRVLTFLAQP